MPDCFLKIQQVLSHPNSDASDLAEVVRTDIATTAMVLKEANSSRYLRSKRKIGDIDEAVARLGMDEVAQIAMVISLVQGFRLPTTEHNVHLFWSHAFLVASLSSQLTKALPDEECDFNPHTIFTGGLLHDIGRALLGLRIDQKYFSHFKAEMDGVSLLAEERRSYGVDHAEAGAVVMERWAFPQEMVTMVAQHHMPIGESCLAAAVVQWANRLAHLRGERLDTTEKVSAALVSGEVLSDGEAQIAMLLEERLGAQIF
ncbi:MAG: HDOD domain-containing protein [Mariprofundales bacterium]|nr:HDOD domain-containing protein [Mariprofundales bacterium]